MKIYGIIYKSTNLTNYFYNKCYIGQTIQTLNHRKYAHIWDMKNGSKKKFHIALREYGIDSFSWSILDVCYSKEELEEKEKYWIKFFNSIELGYNLSPGGKIPCKGIFEGNKNPRYNDHRTWEQLHGKTKADKMKNDKSNIMKMKNIGDFLQKQRELKHGVDWNPMNENVYRNKIRIKAIGSNNSQAKYNYKIITPDIIYETNCMREFCRDNNFNRTILHNIELNINYKSRNKKYHNWKVIKTLKY
jgi:group I intron endonuclease